MENTMKKMFKCLIVCLMLSQIGCANQKRILELEKRMNHLHDKIHKLEKDVILLQNDLEDSVDVIMDNICSCTEGC